MQRAIEARQISRSRNFWLRAISISSCSTILPRSPCRSWLAPSRGSRKRLCHRFCQRYCRASSAIAVQRQTDQQCRWVVEACGRAIRQLPEDAGLSHKVAVITGDDLMQVGSGVGSEPRRCSLTNHPREAIASANAYLGAFPIAEALNRGADIVVTGRCVDAVTLGACIHRFSWQRDDLDLLAAGSLVSRLIEECGPQATGGNYTDWHQVADTLHEVKFTPLPNCCRRRH